MSQGLSARHETGRVVRRSMDEPDEPLPARMLNEWAYCPRLFHLMHVQRIFVDNRATVEGRGQHDRGRATTRAEDLGGEPPWDQASVREHVFASADGRIVGKFDAIGTAVDGAIVPVEAKRGRAPEDDREFQILGLPCPDGVWPNDFVQVAAQGVLARDSGYRCVEARVHYRGSRKTVVVPLDDRAVAVVDAVVAAARATIRGPMPDPLADSPKCFGCSLNGICLPDETRLVNGQTADPPRKLLPGRADGGAMYVVSQGASVGKSGETLTVRHRDERPAESVPLKDVEHVSLFGHAQISSQAVALLLEEGKHVFWHRRSGQLVGFASPPGSPNVAMRRAQFRAAELLEHRLDVARLLVAAKVANQRTLVRRNLPEHPLRSNWLEALGRARIGALSAETLDGLRGHEGLGARIYFEAVSEWLARSTPAAGGIVFKGRSRRPPRDPVNAALSFGYALLTSDAVAAVRRVGLDPDVGFLHDEVPGRPALALDLMEPFRPVVVDSLVLRAFTTGELSPDMFVEVSGAGVRMKDPARRTLLEAYERRMDELVTHPMFDYRVSYRRCMELDARLLGRFLLGDVRAWQPMVTR